MGRQQKFRSPLLCNNANSLFGRVGNTNLGTRRGRRVRVIWAEFWSKFALGFALGFVRNRGESARLDGQNFSPSGPNWKPFSVGDSVAGAGKNGAQVGEERVAVGVGNSEIWGVKTVRSGSEKLRRSARIGPVVVVARASCRPPVLPSVEKIMRRVGHPDASRNAPLCRP